MLEVYCFQDTEIAKFIPDYAQLLHGNHIKDEAPFSLCT